MCRLQELQPSVLDERDIAAGQLHLEHVAVMRCPEQHGLAAERRPALSMLQDLAAHRVALLRLIQAGHEHRALRARPVRPQGLLVTLGRAGDDLVGGGQDWRCGTIVALEPHDSCPGEPCGEIQDIADRGRTERVDGLGVVADHGHVSRRPVHVPQDVGLEGVGVLVLVHQEVIEHRLQSGSGDGVGRHRSPVQQEVVVVDDVLPPLASDVGAEDRADAVDLVPAPGEGGVEDFGQAQLGVHRSRVDRGQRLLTGEAAVSGGHAELATDEVHEIGRVRLVHHGEVRTDTERSPVCPDQSVAYGMERAATDPGRAG